MAGETQPKLSQLAQKGAANCPVSPPGFLAMTAGSIRLENR
jgi:hypothetical protein